MDMSGLATAELPFKREPDPIVAVATRAAMMDDGIAWLMGVLVSSAEPGRLSILHPDMSASDPKRTSENRSRNLNTDESCYDRSLVAPGFSDPISLRCYLSARRTLNRPSRLKRNSCLGRSPQWLLPPFQTKKLQTSTTRSSCRRSWRLR